MIAGNNGYTVIDGRQVELPRVGSLIDLDGRRGLTELLVPCEFPEFAPFRFPSHSVYIVTGGCCAGPACRVEVTGRTIQRRGGESWVRVKVVFVGDGEPDTNAGGWMMV